MGLDNSLRILLIDDDSPNSPKHFARLPAAERSALRQYQKALKAAEIRYRSLFEGIATGVYLASPEGQFLNANPALIRMLGYPDRESLLKTNVADLYVDSEDLAQWRHMLECGAASQVLEARFRRSDGTQIWVRVTAHAATDSGQVRGSEGFVENITDLKQAEAENTRLRQELRNREEHVSFLLKATIDAQEEERERICLDIHDGVAQTLAPAFHYLVALDTQSDLPDLVRARIRKSATLVRDAIHEAREVIATLRPAALDTLGLVTTLRNELEDLSSQAGLQTQLDADQVRFPKAIETALYRIIHEAINNVKKHAHAAQVTVRIRQKQKSRIVVEIQDDGVGMDILDLEHQLHPEGVGLLSMRKRAELLQGDFAVISRPGEGTTVRVEVPLPSHAH